MFKYIIEIFLVGLLFRFIFRYILPVFRMASAAHSQVKKMQDQMNSMNSNLNQNTTARHNTPRPTSEKEGDYIDYEEVR